MFLTADWMRHLFQARSLDKSRQELYSNRTC